MKPVSHTLRLKLSLGVSITLVLLLAPLNWMQYELQRRTAMHELELLAAATGSVMVQGLESAMMSNNRRNIQAVVDSVVDTPEIQSVYILNTAGEVAASPGRAHNGEILEQSGTACQGCHAVPVDMRPRGITTRDAGGQPVFRTMTPILNKEACHRCHEPNERLNGVFYMDFSLLGLNTRLEQSRRNAFWGSLAIIVLTAAAIYAMLSWLVISPLERVADGMRRFGQGRRRVRVAVSSNDEVGLLADVFNEMAATIEHQEQDAERLYAELEAGDANRRHLLTRLMNAREEEQQRLARRIHDVLGQLLTGLSLFLKLTEDAIPPDLPEVRAHLAKANTVVRDTIDQAHGIITELRPTVLDDYGLAPALQEEAKKRLEPAGIGYTLSVQADTEDLPPMVATAAFRIVQEALINVVRHAQATYVRIELAGDADTLTVTLEDDGVGAATNNGAAEKPAYRGTGITGMQERAAAVGGTVRIRARQPRGTRVVLTVPLGAPSPSLQHETTP
jgi:signal transduction histidine kinase